MPDFRRDSTSGAMEVKVDGEWKPYVETGAVEGALVNAGSTLTKMGRGIQSALGVDRAALAQKTREEDSLLSGLREARPVSSFIGEMLPGLASLPVGMVGAPAALARMGLAAAPRAAFLAGGSLPRALGLSTALGAAEGGITLDANAADNSGNAFAGGVGGALGEVGGRMAGRVINAVRGTGASLRRNPDFEFLSKRGLGGMPSERIAQDVDGAQFLQRFDQAGEVGVFGPGNIARNAVERNKLANESASSALGLRTDGVLDSEYMGAASDKISDGFESIMNDVIEQGGDAPVPISKQLANRILKTKGQAKELYERGKFQGLDPELGENFLNPSELMLARRSLQGDATNAGSLGKHELAQDIFDDVEIMDDILVGSIGEDRMADFMKLREQYRNLQILQKRGVVNKAGDVVPKSLDTALRSDTGYGKVFRENKSPLLPETEEMFDVAKGLSAPSLQPFRSSGTAENQAVRELGSAVGQIIGGDVTGGAANLATQAGPGLLLNTLGRGNRGANVVGGLLTPGGPVAGRIGGELGGSQSVLDALLIENMERDR